MKSEMVITSFTQTLLAKRVEKYSRLRWHTWANVLSAVGKRHERHGEGESMKTIHSYRFEIVQIERELKQIQLQIDPLAERSDRLNREIQRLRSLEFITLNHVRKEDIEMSIGDGKPWFNTIWDFAEWLKLNSTKRFCEWNERIYFMAQIINGSMSHGETPGTIRELP